MLNTRKKAFWRCIRNKRKGKKTFISFVRKINVNYNGEKDEHLNLYFMSFSSQKENKTLASHHCAASGKREL